MAEFMVIRNEKVYKERRVFDPRSSKTLFRFEEKNVEWLTNVFLKEDEETLGGALCNVQKMKIFLRYLGDPGFQSGVAEDIGVHQSTVSLTFDYVLKKIVCQANRWIIFPSTADALQKEMDEWQRKYKFPYAIGAVDCTHILIKKPQTYTDEFINRKGVPSMNVQATCNAKEMFTSVDVTWPGSVHDARIWKNSDTFKIMTGNRKKSLLLADSGYGIAPWLMTPYQDPQSPEELAYNKCFKRERVVIERCFGQIKQRFPILQSKIRLATQKIPSVILSCFILHNIAKLLNDEDFEGEEDEEVLEEETREEERDGGINIRTRGQERRNEIANLIHNF